jgi:hypothetical protein
MNIFEICTKKLEEKKLSGDKRYIKRLKWEQEEILVKGKEKYFQDLYNRKIKYPFNQNNILICWLLGIAPDFDIEKDPKCEYGEYPDIDVDFIPAIRNFVKEEWAPKTFGEEYVCNIGNYTTFGLKSALIDMARVHGLPREEILALTKNLDAKDEEGNVMTWDSAMKLYPELKKYCEDHPDVAEASKKLLNRNRGMGVHAGGLIISSSPLPDLVPLVKRKDNPQASAWVEGLHGQDLQPVGLVKFDLLVVSNLLQIAKCCELVKKRHNLKGICALEGQSDWTDVDAWRSDPLSLGMANLGDLKGIFQFDSETVRNMCRNGGVDRFEDLVAYTSLNRPAALDMKMQERYIQRKRGKEEYRLHPLLESILGDTYGVMIYQETIMKVLNVVGNIPLKDCELVRKAISKKKLESFIKYKEMFIINGQKNLNCSEKEINYLYDQVEAFSGYGFNKSVHQNTYIPTPDGLKKICDFQKGDKVYCVNEHGNKVETEVVNLHDHGVLEVYKVIFDDGYEIICTLDHKFLTKYGQTPLREILANKVSVFCEKQYGEQYASKKRINSSLWGNLSFGEINDETSINLQGMQKVGLGRRKNIQISLSNRISKTGAKRQSSKNLRRVRNNKKRKYKGQELKNESVGRTSESSLYICKKNIGPSGNSTTTSRAAQKMERRKPRKICKVYGNCLEELQKVKNGILAVEPIKLGNKKNSLWEKKRQNLEAGGYGQGQDMDRSRWILSLLRTFKDIKKLSIAHDPAKRFHAKPRMFKKKKYYVNKIRHELFSQQYWSNEIGLVGSFSNHAQITNTRGLVSRRVLRVLPVGKQRCYDLEVACPTHNFILPNGVITSNSHATAYTYISAYLLYLKSHYPHEFYTSILSCENLSDKIKEYKTEAKLHNVKVCRLDVNKSKITFDLQGKEIYFGLSNVKGIGEGPATRIVQNQPYSGFEDFLERFGTEANVLKPLIGLRCFEEKDPVTLWKFADAYKVYSKKIEDKKKRHIISMEKYEQEFKEIFPQENMKLSDIHEESPYENDYWKKYDKSEFIYVDGSVECSKEEDGAEAKIVNGTVSLEFGVTIEKEIIKYYKKVKVKKIWNRLNAFKNLWNKRKRSLEKYGKIREEAPNLINFNAEEHDIDPDLEKEFNDPILCENKYYGFAWVHPLEFSPDYKGNLTFDNLKNDPNIAVAPVELLVVKATKNTSKKGAVYYQVLAEDSTGQQNKINIWQDDWERWSKEFIENNLLRVRLQPPSNGFATFTLESNQGRLKWRGQKKYSDKKDDIRVFVMRKGSNEEL